MQHVERNKCVFISSRLIYSLLACRRESRTTICIGVWRNDVDVSYHIVFLHYDPFYCYIATVFLFARMCACTLCIKQKATLRGAQRRELNTKMGRKSEIAAERREGRDATGSKCIILSIRPQPMIKMEIFFSCIHSLKKMAKQKAFGPVCLFLSLIMRVLGFVLRCLSSVD